MKNEAWNNLYAFAKQEASISGNLEEVENKLRTKTNDQQLIDEILKDLKKERRTVKLNSGLTKLGIGGALLILGFLITCINYHSNTSFTIVMYGFTTVGLLLMFLGLYDIIG